MKNPMNVKEYNNLNLKSSNRLTGADGLRAIACLSVIVHHFSQQISAIDKRPLFIQKVHAFALMGNTGVSIFFILSGFLLSYPFWKNYLNKKDYPSIKEYALRRAARIMPGFYVALIASTLLVIILNIPVEYLWVRLVASLTFVSGFHYVTFFPSDIDGALWSISFEVFCYFLMPIFMYILFKSSKKERSFSKSLFYWIGVLVFIILANQLVHMFFTPNDVERGWEFGIIGGAKTWMPNYNPVGFFGQFSFGIIAAGVSVQLSNDSEKILDFKRKYLFDIIALLSLIGSYVLLWFMKGKPDFEFSLQSQPYFFPIYQLLIATTLALAPHTNIIGKILDNRFFRYTAKVSFGLYLWHQLLLFIATSIIIKDFRLISVTNFPYWCLLSAAIIICAYIIATLSYKFLEMPIINLVHKNKLKTQSKNNAANV